MKRVRMYVDAGRCWRRVVAAIFFMPLPSRVWAPFELQPHDAESVYVEVPGRLVQAARRSRATQVKKGDLLAELENLDLELEVEQLRGQRDSLRGPARRAANSCMFSPTAAREAAVSRDVASAKSSSPAIDEQLAQEGRGPRAAADRRPARPARSSRRRACPTARHDDDAELRSWTGTPLDPENLGAALTPDGPQNLFCQIGDPNEWDAVLVIDQDDVDLVREGQEVRLMFEESAYHVFVSTIDAAGRRRHVDTRPPRLASTNGGPLPAKAEPDGTVRPLSTSYQAEAPLDNRAGLLRNGLLGAGRIETPPRTVLQRVMRYLSRTFNFEL